MNLMSRNPFSDDDERTILRLIMAAYGEGSLGLPWTVEGGMVELTSELG